MAVAVDIITTYRAPRMVVRRLLADNPSDARMLAYLMLACGLIFAGQWPRLKRESLLDGTIPFEALVGGALFAWLIIAPLALYGMAALSRMIWKVLGGKGCYATARLSLFWSLLAATPLWLLDGIIAGFFGPGVELTLTGLAALAVFIIFWGLAVYETEFNKVSA